MHGEYLDDGMTLLTVLSNSSSWAVTHNSTYLHLQPEENLTASYQLINVFETKEEGEQPLKLEIEFASEQSLRMGVELGRMKYHLHFQE